MDSLEEYDVIVTVSGSLHSDKLGDGLFHEMINGILARDDWEKSSKIPVAMIAGGKYLPS